MPSLKTQHLYNKTKPLRRPSCLPPSTIRTINLLQHKPPATTRQVKAVIMLNPSDPFSTAPDRIAHYFYTKLWRLVYEFRATEALSTPHTSKSLYWYEDDGGTRISPFAAYTIQSLTVLVDEFRGNTLLDSSSPSRFLPNLQKYRHISENRGIRPEPMIVEVILRLPQSSGLIILETWKLSLTYGQSDNLMVKSPISQHSWMYDECQRFCLAIHICINELPTAKFVRQLHSQTSHSPNSHPMGLKIALRLSSDPTNGIEKQFVPYAIRTYTFPPASHLYGNFELSTTCITDISRLLADLSLWNYYPDQLGITFSPSVSRKRAEKPKAIFADPFPIDVFLTNHHQKRMQNRKFLPPGISKLLHLWDPMISDSSYGWGNLAERLIQSRNLDALGPDNEVLPFDEAPPDTYRFGIHIPPRKMEFLDDHEDARRLLKFVLHEKLHSRRRVINSPSTGGSRPSPMIAGASDPITPEYNSEFPGLQ